MAWSGKPAEARQAFEETLRYDPANVEARYDLGMVLAASGDNVRALESFDAALRLKPDFAPAHVARIETLVAAGRYEDAWRAIPAARAAKALIDPRLVEALASRVRH